MAARKDTIERRPFLAAAALCVALGLACSASTLGAAFGYDLLADGAEDLASRGRLLLFCAAGVLVGLSLTPLARSRRLSVSLITGLLVLIGFEALAAPFIGSDTTLFLRDPELGWRLRPDGDDDWLGVRVRTNALGMRGDEPQVAVPQRVLFLGDSVVFGAFLESDSDTISARTEARLLDEGLAAQCLNGGVGGWAPWQERRWYEQEGAALDAGVVTVHLVLNDVTEPLALASLGGTEEGFQLDRARAPGLFAGTTWATALRRWRRSVRGDDPRIAAARDEALGVYELLRSPSLPASRAAWARHLDELGQLVAAIQSRGAVPVVVSHPYTVQFEVPGLWWPQDAVAAWCEGRSVRHLDVGRYIASARPDPLNAYHDAVHPNPEGTALIADALAGLLLGEGLVQ
ncbi:MAG: hypothetical protein CL933_01035 [Deltaproteobacteria bacterium]|nr:hypothetical protein [Deltaproteobacteria bacterium]